MRVKMEAGCGMTSFNRRMQDENRTVGPGYAPFRRWDRG